MSDSILFGTYKVSSGINPARKLFGETRAHNGIDYAVPLNTKVQSTTAGTVIYTGYDADGYGNYVRVRDGSGNTHTYAHLNSISVNTGDIVSRYDELGKSGSTGRSTGAHLHYEVRDSSNNVLNGATYVAGWSDPVSPGSQTAAQALGFGFDSVKDKAAGILQTVIYVIVMLAIMITAVICFMMAFDLSPPLPGIGKLLK